MKGTNNFYNMEKKKQMTELYIKKIITSKEDNFYKQQRSIEGINFFFFKCNSYLENIAYSI